MKVISGGQTGAEQGGLRAAKRLGLPTGGFAPKGWRTENGPAAWLGTEYGLQEHESSEYAPRTQANVLASDATVWFGSEASPGFACTQRAITKTGKPFWRNPRTPGELTYLLEQHNIQTLNVAGNRESGPRPGIGLMVEEFMLSALRPFVL